MTDNDRTQRASAAKLIAMIVAGLLAAAAGLFVAAELGVSQASLVLTTALTPVALYVAVGLLARTSDLAAFEVANRSVPALWNGMSAAAGALPASFLFGLAGLLYALGYDGLAYVLGWTGGMALAAIAIGPSLQMSGARTVADFFTLRFGAAVGVAAAVVIALVSFALLAAETSIAGLLIARFLDIGVGAAVISVIAVAALCAVPGGMQGLTWQQAPQYLVIATAYIATLVYFTASKHGVLLPQLSYGEALAEITRLETGMLEKGLADLRSFQPHVKPFLQLDRLNFFALSLTVMAGVASLPHILARYLTAPSAREARLAGAWATFFIVLLLVTAPAYAAYAKLEIYSLIVKGAALTALPPWLEPLLRVDLVRIHGVSLKVLDDVISAVHAGAGDVSAVAAHLKAQGLVTASSWLDLKAPAKAAVFDAARTLLDAPAPAKWEAFQKSILPAAALAAGNKTGLLTQGALTLEPAAVIAAVPGMAGASWIVFGLLAAGVASAIIATATSLALTIANTLGHDIYGRSIGEAATAARRLAVTRALLLLAAGLAAVAALATPPDAMFAVLSALSLAAAALFPAVFLGLWWRRANAWGAAAGIVVGLAVCVYYIAGTRYMPVSFYETWPHLSNASEAAIRKFVALKAAWANAAEGDAKTVAWAALETQARGTGGKVGLANWFGVHGAGAALFALPAGLLAICLVSLVTPRGSGKLPRPRS
jgi:cation/acetate symporter